MVIAAAAGPDLRVGSRSIPVDAATVASLGLADGSPAAIVIRPERTRIAPAGSSPEDGAGAVDRAVAGRIAETIYLGGSRKVVVDMADGSTIVARVDATDMGSLATGDAVDVRWAPGDGILVLDD